MESLKELAQQPAPCGPAYPALAAMAQCNIVLRSAEGLLPIGVQFSFEEVTLPEELTQDPTWGPRDSLCREGGYDLSGSIGQPATLVAGVEITGEAVDGVDYQFSAWVLTQGDHVCCIWETDGRLTPGRTPSVRAAPGARYSGSCTHMTY